MKRLLFVATVLFVLAGVVPAMADSFPPANDSLPSIAGTAKEGQTLTVDPGTWEGTGPITFSYEWARCTTTGAPCASIAAAASDTYTLGQVDVGTTIRATVTASNEAGSSSKTSAQTSVVAGRPQSASDPVIGAAGDIACDPASKNFNGGLGTKSACREKYTSDLLVNTGLSAVLAVGDVQYECGGYQPFLQSYDPSWGRVKSITHPIPGDHDYDTTGGTDCDTTGKASGYFTYFGAAAGDPTKGYYSFDVGTWHVVALNTNCVQVGGCKAESPQESWLRADLAAHPDQCTLAFWHQPRFSSTKDYPNPGPFYQDLVDAGADAVLVGNQHYYERLAPLNNAGTYDPVSGVREFIVGTGGKSMQTLPGTRRVGSEVLAKTFGVLRLSLHANSYDWQFVPAAGQTFTDSGSAYCHHGTPLPPDDTPPSVPSVSANPISFDRVDLSWTASSDDQGVAQYEIFRDGSSLASVGGATTTYRDGSVTGSTSYTYQVEAYDAAGNASGLSDPVTVTTPANAMFYDAFESGDLSQWTMVKGLTVQQQETYSGSWAARATSTAGTAVYAYKQLDQGQTELYEQFKVKIVSQGANSVNLIKCLTSTGTSVVRLYVTSTGKLAYRNDVAGATTISSTVVSSGTWHTVEFHALVNGASGHVDVWLDGTKIGALSKTENLGTTAMGRVQLGESSTGRNFDVAFDELVVDTAEIP